MSTVVIGVGNCDRGDDGAGLAVVARLRAAGAPVPAVTSLGEPTDLIDAWTGADLAIVVDALVPRGVPGRVHRYDLSREPLPANAFALSTHGLGVVHAVALARALAVLPKRLIVYGIEAARFDPGRPLDAAVARAVAEVADEILAGVRDPARASRAG